MFFEIDEKKKEAIAATDEHGNKLTYGELCGFANMFYEYIGKRTLIFILCKNSFGALVSYVSCLSNRVVPLLLDSKINKAHLTHLIETYHPEFLAVPEDMADEFSYRKTASQLDYAVLSTGLTPFKLNNSLALLLTTSGSTGSPKLVRQSYDNIITNAASIAQYLELDENERPITTLPFNYTYGLSIINSHLLAGGTILFTTKGLMQKEFWDFFINQNATSFGGVPYTYEMLKKLKFFDKNLPNLKTMTQAGGKLDPQLHREFAEYAKNTGKRFFVMYGQTEATARMSYLPYTRSAEKYGSIGIAIPGGAFSLIDTEGKEIEAADVIGELVYKGKNVTLGYAECGDDLAKGDEQNGVLVTGDMAKRDHDGYYYIVGRKKRFLKLFGNRVNMDECEQLIKSRLGEECACAGTDDKMIIYITSDKPTDPIRLFISEQTGINPAAFSVKQIDAIPKNEAGKTLYKELE